MQQPCMLLMAQGMPTSAVSLMRLQFKALTRAMWLIYAAPETAIEKLSAPLTREAEQAAKNLPSAKGTTDQIGKRVGQDAPAASPSDAGPLQGHLLERHELVYARRHPSPATQC